ncbi:MAG: hypothetical protein QM669_12400 [Siphonobacter sp.]
MENTDNVSSAVRKQGFAEKVPTVEPSKEIIPPKNIPLNGFPARLYLELYRGFIVWNAENVVQQSFGSYLIHLLDSPEGVGKVLSKKANEILGKEAIIKQLSDEISALEDQNDRLTSMLEDRNGLEDDDEIEELRSANEWKDARIAELERQNAELLARPVPKPISEDSQPGQFNADAVMAAAIQTIEMVSEYTSPGIRLRTLSKETIQQYFNDAYLKAIGL